MNATGGSFHITALMQAAGVAGYDSDLEMVKLLLDAGADKEATTSDGATALYFAKQQNNVAIADALINHQPVTHSTNQLQPSIPDIHSSREIHLPEQSALRRRNV